MINKKVLEAAKRIYENEKQTFSSYFTRSGYVVKPNNVLWIWFELDRMYYNHDNYPTVSKGFKLNKNGGIIEESDRYDSYLWCKDKNDYAYEERF
jgi:hypothetical protein